MFFKRFHGCHGARHAHGGFGHDHWGHRHGGRGRSGRLFDHGDLRLVILQLIAEKPRHGYDIIKAIEEKAAGAYSPSPGVVYPTLTLLEEQGYAEAVPGEGAKKMFAATPEGRAFLAANRATLDAILGRVAEVNGGPDGGRGGPPPQLLRAMENLKLALRLRLRGGLPEEETRRIAAVLDAAAAEVERGRAP